MDEMVPTLATGGVRSRCEFDGLAAGLRAVRLAPLASDPRVCASPSPGYCVWWHVQHCVRYV